MTFLSLVFDWAVDLTFPHQSWIVSGGDETKPSLLMLVKRAIPVNAGVDNSTLRTNSLQKCSAFNINELKGTNKYRTLSQILGLHIHLCDVFDKNCYCAILCAETNERSQGNVLNCWSACKETVIGIIEGLNNQVRLLKSFGCTPIFDIVYSARAVNTVVFCDRY